MSKCESVKKQVRSSFHLSLNNPHHLWFWAWFLSFVKATTAQKYLVKGRGSGARALANGGGGWSRVAAATVHTNVSECAMNDHSPSLLRSILFSCWNRSTVVCSQFSASLSVCQKIYIRLPICANNSLSQINPAAAAPVNAALGCSPDSLAT